MKIAFSMFFFYVYRRKTAIDALFLKKNGRNDPKVQKFSLILLTFICQRVFHARAFCMSVRYRVCVRRIKTASS